MVPPPYDDDRDDPFDEWQGHSGIFVIVDLRGPVADRIHEIQRRHDPRLAAFAAPHITLVGSSGLGPISVGTDRDVLRAAMEGVAREMPAIELRFGAPVRFMQTDIIALPLDPHGPLRALHDRIGRSGLRFGPSRHAFTPHVTLSLYPTPSRDDVRELLSLRIDDPVRIDHLICSLTEQPKPPVPLLEVTLGWRHC